MKLALGMIVKKGEPWYPLFKDKMKAFDNFYFTEDTTLGISNIANLRNSVIAKAENGQEDWILFLDADEMMFDLDIDILKGEMLACGKTTISLPRVEFVKDFNHYDPTLYPDYQGRAFKLRMGYHFRNSIHEILYKNREEKSCFERGYFFNSSVPIYHYGRCKDLANVTLRYVNYDKILQGQPQLTELPAGYPVSADTLYKNIQLYTKDHPAKGLV